MTHGPLTERLSRVEDDTAARDYMSARDRLHDSARVVTRFVLDGMPALAHDAAWEYVATDRGIERGFIARP